ncbi:hypothetical protein [Aureivirga marina]|uniref:hypothetical protein n=1 Tax=Aureivirga marina TaxID=1182451 RepID=UPI0018CB05D4|nr:hypothetical protein [Aureivirga marina]
MKNNYLKILLYFLVINLISCSSDNGIEEIINPGKLYLKSVYENGELKSSFTYYTDNRVKECYNFGVTAEFYLYEYEEGKAIAYKNGKENYTEKIVVTFENSNLVKQELFIKNGEGVDELEEYIYFNLNANVNCGIVESTVYNQDDTVLYTTENQYLDENCSLISYITQNQMTNVHQEVTNGVYINPFYDASFTKDVLKSSDRNIEIEKLYDISNELSDDSYESSNIVINNHNYVISETRNYHSGNSVNFVFEYY